MTTSGACSLVHVQRPLGAYAEGARLHKHFPLMLVGLLPLQRAHPGHIEKDTEIQAILDFGE